jgi:DNA-binding HxlR family transcriptional regulator
MAPGYSQTHCPVARALDIVGEKWSLLILRDLIRHGPQRFQELERRLPGVAPNTLSTRLKTLEEAGVIETRLYERHPPRYEYLLTEKGQALRPVLKALYAWGERHA